MQSASYPAGRPNAVHYGSTRTGGSWPTLSHNRLQSLSDEELLRRCAANDGPAFDSLISRYYNYIYATAYRLAGNPDDAADLVSETSVRMYRHIHTFHQAVTLPAWIKRIVTNAFLDTRRRADRRPESSLDALVEQCGDALLTDANPTAQSPHDSAESNERQRILADAIRSLPEPQRETVALFHCSSQSYEEIAAQMQIPVGTVKSRLNRARATLREKLLPQMSMLMS